MKRGKNEWPANLGLLLALSMVSKLTKRRREGLNRYCLNSYLKPKKGLLPVEKSILANPL
jgi:hypothetical protein